MEGLYDTSLIFFDGGIAQINKVMSCARKPFGRGLGGFHVPTARGAVELP
ncbi:hypothetical protein Pyn_40217 [Prunus yedoensis var. nudiflora]|uniref:Uncharacterized protein n=1 Tax=Prunus yedoensis var. nudiflora TaxID=2094558 RepID=A0A314YCR0_PRUYE|nr:hypothetical protein Pyn_40217 [Prunus yedoensis var. nudiflora]